MSDADSSELLKRSITRRTALRTGGIGVAAAALGALGGFPESPNVVAAESEGSASLDGMSPPEESLSDVERVARAIEGIEDVVADMMERSGVPGVAISVTHRNETPYIRGFGVRDSSGSDAIDEDTVFHLASLSKPFASTVVAGLVSDGVVSWDSRLSELMPEFAMFDPWVSREVTIRDMMAHRSGLPDHAGDLLEDIGYNRDEILHRLRFQKPAYSLRDGYLYTNFGYTAGAEAAARAAGMTWEEASRKRLYDRLGLSRTTSSHAEFTARSNRALGHMKVDGDWRAAQMRDPDPQSPAGGVSSSARDMARWMRLHLGNGTFDGEEIISSAALAETYRPHSVSQPAGNPLTERSNFYGLGWNVTYDDGGRVRLGHSGAFLLGASTSVSIIPEWDMGISVLTNASPVGLPEAIIASFIDLVTTGEVQRDYLELIGPIIAEDVGPTYSTDYDDPPANATDPLGDSAYLGVYTNELYGDTEISTDGSGLVLHLGPELTAFDLTHYDRDVFLYQPEGENAYGLSSVSFGVDPDGSASQVTIDNLNQDGQGTFTRSNAS